MTTDRKAYLAKIIEGCDDPEVQACAAQDIANKRFFDVIGKTDPLLGRSCDGLWNGRRVEEEEIDMTLKLRKK